MDRSFVIGLLLAIPLSIVANLMTPGIQRRWAATSSARQQKRIAKLRAELKKLTEEENKQSSGSTTSNIPIEKKPILEFAQFETIHWKNEPDLLVIWFRNAEIRYPITAHNISVSIQLTPFFGESVTIKPACLCRRIGNPGYVFKSAISVQINEQLGVVLAGKNAERFYQVPYTFVWTTVDDEWPELGEKLEYGEWQVVIDMDADNLHKMFKCRFTCIPDGSMRFEPAT